MNQIRELFSKIDKTKAKELLFSGLGIYFTYLIYGLYLQKVTTTQYDNNEADNKQLLNNATAICFIQRLVAFIAGTIWMWATIKKQERIKIPIKNSFKVGFLLYVSKITQVIAIPIVGYPFVIMTKSCNLLNVIIIGVYFSKLKNKELKLGSEKLKLALIVTGGILIFRLFDPNFSLEQGKSQLFGIFLLILSLLADGFIPDFQAEVKQKFNPSPIQMLTKFNMLCSLVALVDLVLTNRALQLINYCMVHPQFCIDIVILSFAGFFGQIFQYKILKAFQQHMVPFIMSTRKMITVGLSIVYFGHETSLGQVLGLAIVFIAAIYEFVKSVLKSQLQPKNQLNQQKKQEYGQVKSPSSQPYQITNDTDIMKDTIKEVTCQKLSQPEEVKA